MEDAAHLTVESMRRSGVKQTQHIGDVCRLASRLLKKALASL